MRFNHGPPFGRSLLVGIVALLIAIGATGPRAHAQNVLVAGDATTSPGSAALVALLLTHDGPVQGFQTAVTFDSNILTLVQMNTSGTDLETLLQPDTVEFFLTTIDNAISPGVGWGAVAAIFDTQLPFLGQTLPPGNSQSIVNYDFDVVNIPGLVGTCTPVLLTDGLGPPPGINNVITVNTTSVPPTLVNGQICFVDLPAFIRGDVNSDTIVNVADGVYLLQYLFNSGPTPLCFSAADANDDEGLDISDFIFILIFQFLSGSQPPAPYPGCGVDTTPGTLDCQLFPPC